MLIVIKLLKVVFNDKKVYFMIRNTLGTALLLFLIGNYLKFGDYLVELLFWPIEKELFSCKKKQFYLREEDYRAKSPKTPQFDNTEIIYN